MVSAADADPVEAKTAVGLILWALHPWQGANRKGRHKLTAPTLHLLQSSLLYADGETSILPVVNH